ncbi:UNVERIFIED_ORG: putative nucleic acid-binding protein [Arthrobacter sp. UYEF10]
MILTFGNCATIDVTNNGEVAATLIPPSASPFERLLLAGQVRPPLKARSISRHCRASRPKPARLRSWLTAAALPGKLRSADAIHLAAAIRLQSDVVVAYDAGLKAAAVEAGLNVLSP